MQIAEGSVIAGRYRLEKALARGGMGAVWVARHLQLDSRVAVKFMDAGFAGSPAARVRFEREAKAAAQLQSPHVVAIYDYGIEVGTPFLVMELLQGEDLGTRLKRLKTLSLPTVAGIITHVARALRLAHDTGIVHRDLKPGNIFLTSNDDSEIAKVLDFGIAKMMGLTASVDEDVPTKTDQILGSPQYMSPEQARRSRDVDHRTDLWALGVIAYRAITGKLPFAGESIAEVLVKICTEQAPPPSSHMPDLPLTIDRFFERALAKLPEHRFQSAPELSAAFARAAGVSPASEPDAVQRSREKRLGMRTIPLSQDEVRNAAAAAAARYNQSPGEAQDAASSPAPADTAPTITPLPRGTDPLPHPFVAPGAAVDALYRDTARLPHAPPAPPAPPSSSGVQATTVAPELFGGATPASLSVSSQDLTTKPLARQPSPSGENGAPAPRSSRAPLIGMLAVGGVALALLGALLGRTVAGPTGAAAGAAITPSDKEPAPATAAPASAPATLTAATTTTAVATTTASATAGPSATAATSVAGPPSAAASAAAPPAPTPKATTSGASAAPPPPGVQIGKPKAKQVKDPLGDM
ncbi:MAG: serine/threonine-protein kinase [Minicystis sp.]